MNNKILFFPKGLVIHLYEKSKNKYKVSFVKAKWGKFIEKENIYEIKGNVFIKNINMDVLKTSAIFWNINQHIIYNYVPTKIYRVDGFFIHAKNGIQGSDNLNNIILRNLNGVIYFK